MALGLPSNFRFDITARDRSGAAWRGVESSVQRTQRAVMGFGRMIGPLIGIAGAAGFGQLVSSALSAAEAIQDMSDRANVGTEFLQEMRFAASQMGAESRDFDDAISRLNRRLGLFVQSGGGPAAAAFRQLGLETRIASGELSDTESVFAAAVDAMQHVASQAERSALASQLFGEDSGPRLLTLMSAGTEGINAQREAARELGVVMRDDLVTQAANASDALERMGLQFSTAVNSAIAENADELVVLAEALAKVAEWAITAAGALGDLFRGIGETAGGSVGRAGDTVASVQAEIDEQTRRIGVITGGGTIADIENERLRDHYTSLMARLHTLQVAAQADATFAALIPPPAAPLAPDNSLGRNLNPSVFEGQMSGPDMAAMGPVPRQSPRSIPQQSAAIDRFFALAATKAQEFGSEQVKAQLEALHERREEFSREFGQSMADGIEAAFSGDLMEFIAKRLQRAAYDGMANALEQVGASVFDQLFGGAGQGGGGGNAIVSAVASAFGFGGGRAAGGGMQAGMMYRVGEKGPETIVSGVPAHVFANGGPRGGVEIRERLVFVSVDKSEYFETAVQQAATPIAQRSGLQAYGASEQANLNRARREKMRLR
tara:strand:- start:16374 stop:18188 length:1815 start_codon:yes stop_codon:yes gene_type:complete